MESLNETPLQTHNTTCLIIIELLLLKIRPRLLYKGGQKLVRRTEEERLERFLVWSRGQTRDRGTSGVAEAREFASKSLV